MLVFIVPTINSAFANAEFQYIPCWYLSIRKSDRYLRFLSFNTSHVGIYRSSVCHTSKLTRFQYIPCWYLSNEFKAFPFLPFLVYPCIIYHFLFFYQPFRKFFNFLPKVLQVLILSTFQAFPSFLQLVKNTLLFINLTMQVN